MVSCLRKLTRLRHSGDNWNKFISSHMLDTTLSAQNSTRRGYLTESGHFIAFFTQSMIPADLHPDEIMPFPLSVKSHS